MLNHTDPPRDRGASDDIDLSHLDWANDDLVLIDESHNFRNRLSGKGERKSRYDNLKNAVIRADVKTRALATPVNNRLNDLKNRTASATEGDDRALSGHGVVSFAATLRAQVGASPHEEGSAR